MTRKDYVLIAQAIRDQMNAAYGMFPSVERTVALATITQLAERMSGVFAINPNFKPEVFLKACGVSA
jgi:hypothetical protein